ncbi:MAG: glycosyltransferase family 9 protein, partial [Candidatus Marinimicrobia bacterium]|nr:glycosyltransferase family 9 protein [Candidatus Neomarinimicrobiota bacterium]
PQVSRIKKGIFKRFLLTKFKIYKPPYLHVTQKYLKVLECETPSIPSSFLYLPSETCIQEKNKEIYTVLKTSQKSLILAPGASKPSKMLPFETWEKVIDDVYRKFEKIVIIGNGAEESEWARKMSQEGKSETIIDLTGRLSLCELMLFISQGIIFVGNDSGPAHLAAMLGLKTLVIFGQTVPEYGFTPLNSPILIEPPSHLLCRPCGHLGHDVCPKKHHLCMQSIDAESIICEIYYVLQTNEDIKNTHENRVY